VGKVQRWVGKTRQAGEREGKKKNRLRSAARVTQLTTGGNPGGAARNQVSWSGKRHRLTLAFHLIGFALAASP